MAAPGHYYKERSFVWWNDFAVRIKKHHEKKEEAENRNLKMFTFSSDVEFIRTSMFFKRF